MKIKKIIILNVIILVFTYSIFNAKSIDNEFSSIIGNLDCEIKEYSVVGQFTTDIFSKDKLDNIIKLLECNLGKLDYKIVRKDNLLYLNFFNNTFSGDLEVYPDNKSYTVKLSCYLKEDNLNYLKIDKLKVKISSILSQFDNKIDYSQCIKVKLKETSEECKENILDRLKENKLTCINTVKIYNGYSIVANLGSSNDRNIYGTNIDLQCAIVDYSSGCYLIMGSPEITLAY